MLGQICEAGEVLTLPQITAMASETSPQLAGMADDLVAGVLSLYTAQMADPSSAAPVAEGVSASPLLELEADERKILMERLKRLLEADAIRFAAKAFGVLTDYDNVFVQARVLTDVRPVFADDAADTPAAAVIVNTLRIDHYAPDSSLVSFHVALDRDELLALRKVIDRGLEKTEGMKRFLEAASLTHWEQDSHADA